MRRTTLAALLLAALVPVSSLLGLARAMLDQDGLATFAAVWKASLWGDLAFAGGTVAAAWVVAVAGQRLPAFGSWPLAARLPPAVAASFLLHWAVYAMSWSFTGNAANTPEDAGQHFFAWTFGNLGDAWGWTFEWGWPGLLFCALAVPLAAALLERRWAMPHGDADGGFA
ncbi:MAG: hypothetical protein LC623_03275 [Halobacteriales archaeon]|nr:hypothetical protein [Halobacteriales archaeon]